jgi:hypothetical protein
VSATSPASEFSTTYDFRGVAQTTLQLLGESGSRAWVNSFGWSNRSRIDTPAARVDANARVAMNYLAERLGTDLFAAGNAPLQIVHPDDPQAGSRRPKLFTRGPFYAGKGVSIFPDGPDDATDNAASAFSLHAVAHAVGHALVDSTSRLLYRGEAGTLNEGIAELIGRGATRSATGRDAAVWPTPSGPAGSDPFLITRIVEAAAQRAAADGMSIRPGLERVFLRATAFMLPADATLQMARAATLQAARDLESGRPIERYLRAAWNDAGVR